MPHALDLDERFRDRGLAVILVHCQPHADVAAWVRERWPTCRAMLTAENTVEIGSQDQFKLPRCALVGVDGTILADGLRAQVGAEVDRLIAAELAKLKRGWGATPELAKARALIHAMEDFDSASKLLEGLQVAAEAESDLEAVRAELKERFERRLGMLRFLVEAGRWVEAENGIEKLERRAKTLEDEAEDVATLAEPLRTPEGRKVIAAERRFDKIMAAVSKRGPRKEDVRRIDKLLRGIEETAVGRRINEAGTRLQVQLGQ